MKKILAVILLSSFSSLAQMPMAVVLDNSGKAYPSISHQPVPELTLDEVKNLTSLYVTVYKDTMTIVRYDVGVPETEKSMKICINNTAKFSDQTRRELSYLKPGDYFIFQNIMAKMNDSEYVTPSMLTYKILK
ncbi:MAG: hypothetical protein NT126_01565 [Bacteroidetes bacterium]|nr:hypothetical protein [Bacteroidota bacterium]